MKMNLFKIVTNGIAALISAKSEDEAVKYMKKCCVDNMVFTSNETESASTTIINLTDVQPHNPGFGAWMMTSGMSPYLKKNEVAEPYIVSSDKLDALVYACSEDQAITLVKQQAMIDTVLSEEEINNEEFFYVKPYKEYIEDYIVANRSSIIGWEYTRGCNDYLANVREEYVA